MRMIFIRPCKRKECQGRECRHKHFHYRFRVNGVRYRGAIPEARTRWDAGQAEAKIKRDIFEGKYGTPASGKPYTDIKHSFDTACAKAGIEGLWWHDLRATFGTRLGADGHGISTIIALIGHRDPKTCLRYVRATDPPKRAAVQSAFGQPGHKMDTLRLVAV